LEFFGPPPGFDEPNGIEVWLVIETIYQHTRQMRPLFIGKA
jgi:hypothetical protein